MRGGLFQIKVLRTSRRAFGSLRPCGLAACCPWLLALALALALALVPALALAFAFALRRGTPKQMASTNIDARPERAKGEGDQTRGSMFPKKLQNQGTGRRKNGFWKPPGGPIHWYLPGGLRRNSPARFQPPRGSRGASWSPVGAQEGPGDLQEQFWQHSGSQNGALRSHF